MLKTKCNSVQKRVRNALSHTLLHSVCKIFKKKIFTLFRSTLMNNLRFFTYKCTHIIKKVNINFKVFKMQLYCSVTLQVSPKTPISEESKKKTSAKIQILPQKKISEWFGHKTTEPICFRKSCMKNQRKLIISKICGFRSRKGSNIWTLL